MKQWKSVDSDGVSEFLFKEVRDVFFFLCSNIIITTNQSLTSFMILTPLSILSV